MIVIYRCRKARWTQNSAYCSLRPNHRWPLICSPLLLAPALSAGVPSYRHRFCEEDFLCMPDYLLECIRGLVFEGSVPSTSHECMLAMCTVVGSIAIADMRYDVRHAPLS